jgi:putative transposase
VIVTVVDVLLDVLQLLRAAPHSHQRLAAENLFLRKQLALYIERQATPRRATNATRLTLVILTRFIDWRPLLTIVQPDTLVRWHREAFWLFWR